MDFCDLPPKTIRKFSIGFYLAAATLSGILALVFFSFRIGWSAEAYAATISALSFVWFAAVWLMTTPLDVPYDKRLGAPWELKARTFARWLQLGWFANAVVAWVHVTTTPMGGSPPIVLVIAYIVTEFAGVAGIALLCLLLASFSAWVRDDFAERCFNFTFGGLAILSPVLFFVVPLFQAIVPILFLFFLLLWFVWVGSIFAFPVGLWSLARTLTWARRHSKDRIERATEVANSLAPEPSGSAADAPARSEEPIPLETPAGEQREIHYSLSSAQSGPASSTIKRERYDHERGDARGSVDGTPQPDIF